MWMIEKSHRIKIMTGVIVGVIILLIARLAWMQLVNGPQYKKMAEQNRIRQMIVQ